MKAPTRSPAELLSPGRALTLANVAEGAEGLIVSDLARAVAARPKAPAVSLAVICRDGPRMSQMARALEFFAPDLAVMQFPAWDCQPYDRVSPHGGIVAQRVTTLARLSRLAGSDKPLIVLTTVNAVTQRVPAREVVAAQALSVAPGNVVPMDSIVAWLEHNGYNRSSTVRESGEYAVRGGILDLFPAGLEQPVRFDFFGDALESIRTFDAETQRTLMTMRGLDLVPVAEFQLVTETIRRFRMGYVATFGASTRDDPLYEAVSEGRRHPGMEHWLPLFQERMDTLFDYLGNAPVVIEPQSEDAARERFKQINDYYDARREALEHPGGGVIYKPLPPDRLYLTEKEWDSRLADAALGRLTPFAVPEGSDNVVDAGARQGRNFAPERADSSVNVFESVVAHVQSMQAARKKVVVALWSEGSRDRMASMLKDHKLLNLTSVNTWRTVQATPRNETMLAVVGMESGFETDNVVFITEQDILGDRLVRPRKASRKLENFISEVTSLATGDIVVHVEHGIGRFVGLQTLDVAGAPHDCLELRYANETKLFLPVENIELLSRYGSDQTGVELDKLGGGGWQARKAKLKNRIREIAGELIKIAAERHLHEAPKMPVQPGLYDEFCARFPYEETEDQLAAINATLHDLESGKPMDRLVCGDVGFGKTEVALRAAVAAASAGKQVAVLVPTTLLAQQHYDNFRDRLADFPIRVELLSRFRAKKDADDALKRLADGKLDIVVGTHKLLQPDVKFKDLGLVIVDEEHRFGVRHKEQLKKLRAEVDLLTLTATPIPRTLNMAMSGMRDLSIIATPPAARMAVKTLVAQYDPALVREAFQRELARGGQVYFLHNSIDSIQRVARELGELVPDARIRVAHGQMSAHELEQAMLDFHRQRFNVLVCTTIIESGIDVPTANTIVIDRADRFGLAQLHQLRGRVGRSHHRAYAYLIVPDRNAITADAEKRLAALESLEELGAGFTLATHDMEIRGAGELLGEAQSGQIEAIGFALYNDLLERAVRALRSGKVPDFDLGGDTGTEIELHLPALIPDDYLPDVHARLTLYKRIASATEDEGLRDLQVEMIDRFGLLPQATKNLFAIASLKLRAHALGIRKLDLGAAAGRITFRAKPDVDPATIIRLIQKQPRVYKLDGQDKLRIAMELPEPADRLRMAGELLETLAARAMAA